MPAESLSVPGLISAATQVNYFIVTGGLLAMTAVIAKLFIKDGSGTVKFLGFEVPLNHTWLAMALLTVAHVFYAWALLVEIAKVLDCGDASLSNFAWRHLTQNDADKLRVFYHMSERKPLPVGFLNLSNVSSVGVRDLMMLFHLLFGLAVFAATVRWFRTRTWRLRVWTTLAAILLVAVNWTAGSQWALLSSDLIRQGKNTPELMRKLRENVVRYSGETCDP